jgi:hypothetical protein
MSELLAGTVGETSSGQHVLMKDQARIKKAVRHTTVIVNSRDRNYLSYPNSNNFRHILRRPLTNVLSVELVNCTVPALIYTIQDEWNKFTFVEGAKTVILALRPGLYTETQLCTELQYQLNNSGLSNTYTVVQNPITRIITITATVYVSPFSFKFFSGSPKDQLDLNNISYTSLNTPARQLGFGFDDYSSGIDYSKGVPVPASSPAVLVAVLPMDIGNFLTRMYLHIESDGKNLDRMERGGGRKDCFHVFNVVPGITDYINLDALTQSSIFESKPAPIARMANLQISLRDEFDRLLNIGMREVHLTLEITHLE